MKSAPEAVFRVSFFLHVLVCSSAPDGFSEDLRAPLELSEAREFGAKVSLTLVRARPS